MKSPFRKRFVVLHHSLVSYDKNSDQFDAIDRYHKSKGWGRIGYNYTINKIGKIKVGRLDNEITAAARERMMNYRGIHICVEGNFDHELPTEEQMLQLKNLVARLRKEYNIKEKNVIGHRFVSPKSCPGSLFTDYMIKQVARNENHIQLPSKWATTAWMWATDNQLITKSPHANCTKEELAVVLKRFEEYLRLQE